MPEEMSVCIKPQTVGYPPEMEYVVVYKVAYNFGNGWGIGFRRTSEDVACHIIDCAREMQPSRIRITSEWSYPQDDLDAVRELVYESTGIEVE